MTPQEMTPQEEILAMLQDLRRQDFQKFKWYLQQQGILGDFPAIRVCRLEDATREDTVDLMRETYGEDAVTVANLVLEKMKKRPRTVTKEILDQCQKQLKSTIIERFSHVDESETSRPPLKEIYTDLYIMAEETGGVNLDHERESWNTSIRCEDIFKASPHRKKPRTVMTKGVAGIGKTVLTQKFAQDWAEDKHNQDIEFMFVLTFRELNILPEQKYSLVKLIHHFFTETKKAGICRFEDYQVVFIFDGLDECRLPLNFQKTKILTDATKSSSVHKLLINLIRGKLLPSARLWITTRPAAANLIPFEFMDMVTEVRGFTDPQKELFFRKRFRDEDQADRIISHIQTSRSLHIMCHIPVFCWITAKALEGVLKTSQGGELPKTLTEMYIHFLVIQSKVRSARYHDGSGTGPHWDSENRKTIKALAKLAFKQLKKRNQIFYEADLRDCGIDLKAAAVYSGVFTETCTNVKGMYKETVFCFVHLSVQEFLAALHVHLTFINSGINVMSGKSTIPCLFTCNPKQTNLYQIAVDKALLCPTGHMDLFLRFLLGLSLETNRNLLRWLVNKGESNSETIDKTIQYIKERISKDPSAERSINMFHCLNEMNDRSLVENIQQSLNDRSLATEAFSPAQWSALVFILLSSSRDLDVFDLKKYSASEEALLKLLMVVKASRKALLSGCNLSEKGCEALSSVLASPSSGLRHLDLSHNDLHDSGVEHLCVGLKSPHCSLESLSLAGCRVTEKGCSSLASALSSNPSSRLRDLDLRYNLPGEAGKKDLSKLSRRVTLRFDHGGGQRLEPGVRKCEGGLNVISDPQNSSESSTDSCEQEVDTNTINQKLSSDDKRTMTDVKQDETEF